MTASTSVNSNALNFMSCLKGGVDPRTGLYTVSISLPELQSNDLRGPGLKLGLNYSPLNTLDVGFGMGWTMQLSEYDPGKRILALSTGETFKVTSEVPGPAGNRLLMEEQKLDSFHFYQDAPQDGAARYRVMHKSGLVEILEKRGNDVRRVALPVRALSASGHGVTLDYLPFSTTHQQLSSIKDDLGNTLLEIKRSDYSVEYLVRPYDGPDGKPLARFVMTLDGADKWVTAITLPTDDQASWEFAYGFRDNQSYIEKVRTPAGGREEIYYLDNGHPFPISANLPDLPRVTQHIVFPGFDQPHIDVRYTYEVIDENNRPVRNNFLGSGLTISWENDGLDNLYKTLNEYDYFCTESVHVDGQLAPVRSIERKFNRFHLQTREVTTQGDHVQTQETTYNIVPGKHYREQPVDCQLPEQIQTSWRILSHPNLARFETVSNTYDSHGNLRSKTRADGIVEESRWYPAVGDEGCPSDPEGFVRHLKEKIVSPAPSDQSGAPTLSTRYRYKSLPPITGSGLANMIVPESESLVQLLDGDDELQLQNTLIDIFNEPDDYLRHGHIRSQTATINDKSTLVTYTYETCESLQLEVPVLEITQTLTTDVDSASKTLVQQHSPVTGQELVSVVDGVETRRAYDALNRLTSETVGYDTVAGDPTFIASREYQYTLCARLGAQAEQVVFNARRASTRTFFDGLGRRVSEEQDKIDSDNPDLVRKTYAAQYDALGQLKTETAFDWIQDIQKPAKKADELALPLTYVYDDWGQQACVIAADGVETHQQYDPIGTVESGFRPIQRNWVQSAGASPIISGRSETWLNDFGKADMTASLDAAQNVLGSQTFLYDGLGRCTQQTDALHHTTHFSYDPWSRMVSSTLPDKSVVTREYALHSSAELPIALRVLHPDGDTLTVAGEQVFDGLERMTQVKVGKRIEQYAYDGDSMQVRRRTTAAGDTIDFAYNLMLTDQPVSSTALDEHAEFSYDNTSARLTRAANELGERTYDYDQLNRLRGEQWRDRQGKLWKTTYVSSSRGRLLRRTELQLETNADLDAAKDAAKGAAKGAGLDTVYHYDALGRVDTIDQGNIQAALEYDALSQLNHITTRDLAAGTTLGIELTYDDQGREVCRTLTQDSHPPFTLEQQWQIDGQLKIRHLQQGGTSLLKETFKYDSRGRLTSHTCEGSERPRDAERRVIAEQIFAFDALDNVKLRMTTFADDKTELTTSADDKTELTTSADDKTELTTSADDKTGPATELAIFVYDNSDEPCQLTGITYLPGRPTPDPAFCYDPNGNQLNDERGQQMVYDIQSRLQSVEQAGQSVSQYRYDSHDHLVTSQHGSTSETLRFYQDQQLSSSVQDDEQRQYLFLGDQPLGQQQADDVSQTLLLLIDPNRSVLGESQQKVLRTAVYNAYGERHSDQELLSDFGYNGEVRDPSSGWYLLGRGYRAYNPGLMRFHSPDSLSPFGAGGLNPYTYCLGNPIALRDPTGHDASGQTGRLRRPDEDLLPNDTGGGSGWLGWAFVAVGVVGTIGLAYATVASLGTAAPVTVPLMGMTISGTTASAITVASYATATALTAVSTGASAYAAVNGDETANTVALWTGVASIPFGMGAGWLNGAVKARGAYEAGLRSAMSGIRNTAVGSVNIQGGAAAATSAGGGGAQAVSFAQTNMRLGRFRFTVPKPAAPAAPVPPPMPSAAMTSEHSALLESIRAGTKLNKTNGPAKSLPTGSGDELRAAVAARKEKKSVAQAVAAARQAGGRSALLAKVAEKSVGLILDVRN